MKINIMYLFYLLVSLLALSACGGGGDGGPNVLTGQLVDGPVSGVRYQTTSQSGMTNANGEFTYQAGETVQFYIGDILLGVANGQARITPFDLADVPVPRSRLQINLVLDNFRFNEYQVANNYSTVINLAVFFQSVDEDGDATNGIQVPAQLHTIATGRTLNFGQLSERFQYDPAWRTLMGEGRRQGLWGSGRAVRKPTDAMDALYAGLGLSLTYDYATERDLDSDGDNVPDGRENNTYDERGYRTRYQEDNNRDGNPEFILTYAYDSRGNRVLEEETEEADVSAVIDYRQTRTYDENNNLITVNTDTDADGPDPADRDT